MKRSANCMQMLFLLKSRGFLTRKEIAEELQCKLRNISEYKKELELAGYEIISSSGKYGGYQLDKGTLFAVKGLSNQEVNAIQESLEYMKSHSDFLQFAAFQSAMDKVLASTNMEYEQSNIYLSSNQAVLSKKIRDMIQVCEYAKLHHKALMITYKGMNAKEYENFIIHPYEILNYKGAYYCLAYSLKAKDYRNFKFSEERMQALKELPSNFNKDIHFQVQEHVGKLGLMKDDVYTLEFIAYDETALLIAERGVGLNPEIKWIDEHTLSVKTMMEGKLDVITFLLSLGRQCKLIAPIPLKDEIYKIIKDMEKQYFK